MNIRCISCLAVSLILTHPASAQDIVMGTGDLTLSLPEKPLFRCNPGPWGDLEYYPIILEAPAHMVKTIPLPSAHTMWSLPGMTISQVRELLVSAAIREDWIHDILESSRPHYSGSSFRFYPPTYIVEGLNRESRSILYAALRPWSENRFHRSPVIIESGNTHEWFSGSGLSPDTIDRIDKMTYRIGDSLAFSDVSAILTRIHSDREEQDLLKALTRNRSLILRLRISPDSDREALKNYWSIGFKNKDVLPYLESIIRTPGIQHVDLIHLLPPTPRKYLNTFPTLSLGIEGTFPGSFWTSLNFFRFHPLDDFKNGTDASAHIRDSFSPAEKPYRFGDLFLIKNADTNRAFHACIYIADDIVYSKNGTSPLRPFMLMKLDDLLARYSMAGKPVMSVWRHNKKEY